MHTGFIEVDSKHYILASSSFADDRTIAIKQGNSFGIFDRYGDIHPLGRGAQGLYHEGTRFLSQMEFLLNGERPLFLSSALREANELLSVDLTNPDYIDQQGKKVPHGTLHILRSKFLWEGVCYERLRFTNFGLEPVSFSVSLQFYSDFADIFEVRGMERSRKGLVLPPENTSSEVRVAYEGLDGVVRRSRIGFSPAPAGMEASQATYAIQLPPRQTTEIFLTLTFETGKEQAMATSYQEAQEQLGHYIEQKNRQACHCHTSNEQFNNWLNRSAADLITMVTETAISPYPYAGVPWYSTPFGRDGIITAFECLWMQPEVARGVLAYLAATQAQAVNEFQDAQPGKILHEQRSGEMAQLGEIPFKQYYGTVDATPLFISLAGAYWERTHDLAFIRSIWPNIERALHWIATYGDVDGDGFVEYASHSKKGLRNQGWKDSEDSIFHQNGQLAEGPIALCEVQGYVYDAKKQASRMARALGLGQMAARLEAEAEELKEKFSRAFWWDEKSTYVLALDGKKRPCRVVASNAGHCLFSGIATQDQAMRLAQTLLGPALYSGWGIRTLADGEIRYNPMSYHNGSVWPHDNALIAYGLARYGLKEGVLQILAGMFDAALFVDLQRLPELFCGFERRKGEGPTAYPVACSPQAWAVGTVFLLLQACLGLRVDAAEQAIYFNKPVLPPFLEEVTIRNLDVNGQKVALQIRRQDHTVTVQLLDAASKVQLILMP